MQTQVETLIGQILQGSPETTANPYPFYQEVRDAGPIHFVEGSFPLPGGSWHITRYADAFKAIRDSRFSSHGPLGGVAGAGADAVPLDQLTSEERERREVFRRVTSQSMLTLDPPDHTRLRMLAANAFTPRIIEAQRSRVQALVNDQIDNFQEAEGMDIINDLSQPLPLSVVGALIGIPSEDWEQFRQWFGSLTNRMTTDQSYKVIWEMTSYLRHLASQRRIHPQDDLMSAFLAAQDQRDALSEDELIAECIVLLGSGTESTTAAIGNAVLNLLRRPAAWQTLKDHTELLEPAVEELLRYESPFQFLARIVKEDMDMYGQHLSQGERVWIWLGSANHDPAQFENPEELNLAREKNLHLTHMAFGGGIHYCLGSALARMELQIVLSTLLRRYPNMSLASDSVIWRQDLIRGPKTLPVIFNSASDTMLKA